MSKYIDADALREHLQNKLKTDYEMGLYNHGALTESFIRFVERQPTADVVAVVRCKDCIHAREVKHRGEVIEGIYRCSYIKMSTNLFDIDYCRYGKRRSENEG